MAHPTEHRVDSPTRRRFPVANEDMEPAIRLAAGLAHRLNNILTVVGGHASILLETVPAGDPIRESIKAISGAGEAGTQLTDQLLAFAGQRPVNPGICRVTDLLNAARSVAEASEAPSIGVDFSEEPGLPDLMVDPLRFEEILRHLTVYGQGLLEGGGRIQIRAEAGPALGDAIMLRLTMTGSGAEALTPYGPFEPFAAHSPRVGIADELCLAAAWGAVLQSGGSITAATNPLGITFSILLPTAG